MAYCDEKKQNGWKSTKTQPTDVTLFVGWLLYKSLIEEGGE